MIIFYFREAFRIFRKSSLATAITITITTIAVILSTISIFLVFSANKFSDQIKQSIEVNVYLNENLSQNEIDDLKVEIQKIISVQSVAFVNKDQAVINFVKETGQDFRSVLDENPLPNSFVVKFKPQPLNETNIEQLTDQIRKMKGVTEVIYDYKTVLRILNLLKSFEYVIYFLSITLILLATYLVYSNNKIQMYGNRNHYLTMKLVGAQISTMKIPLILNGIIIGFISSLICILLLSVISILLAKVFINFNFINPIKLMNLIILLIGLALGFIGSFISSLKISRLLEE
ncbi:MAG: hypothetical protein FIA82_11360 [Melioribacter sp.]|nr:hypothetical protein [Melioribacter sp.]